MIEIIPDKSYWLLGILEYASENTEEEGVKGSLKLEKLNVLVRQKMIKMGHEEDNWELMMKPFGPADPGGLSRMLPTRQSAGRLSLSSRTQEWPTRSSRKWTNSTPRPQHKKHKTELFLADNEFRGELFDCIDGFTSAVALRACEFLRILRLHG